MTGSNKLDLRLAAGVAASKLSSGVIRRLGRGGGTAAPGVVANTVDSNLLDKLATRVSGGCIVVAGTNGKTTTSRMLAGILESDGKHVVHNRTGSNLVRGISAAFAAQSSWTGQPYGDIAVLESDEAAFPEVVRRTSPRVIVLLNLFRDQLDRYGELDTIAQHWRAVFETLRADQVLLVNGDDPTLSAITDDVPARRLVFGLQKSHYTLSELPHSADSAICRRCGSPLKYERLYMSHLGEYHCSHCGFCRPALEYRAVDLELHSLKSISFNLEGLDEPIRINVGVPGLYNAYNALAAAAAALVVGVSPPTVSRSLQGFQSAFGRIERVTYRDRQLVIVLIKNPVGFDEVLRMLAAGMKNESTMIVINDLDADGRDVSWLWDVNVEQLASGTAPLYTSGIRGPDMANRLKYAGIEPNRIHPLGQLADGFDQFVDDIPVGETGYILPTYTAMLELRQMLAHRGVLASFWRQ